MNEPRLDEGEDESLKDAVRQTMEEARMVTPGVQAVLGFQLMAVFNPRFDTALDSMHQGLHLLALLLISVSVVLLMAPAAYHRQSNPRRVSAHLLRLSSRLISGAMLPLAVGLALDVYLVALVVTRSSALSASLSGALLALAAWLWFLLPRVHRRLPRG
jgi:hypothetical protein